MISVLDFSFSLSKVVPPKLSSTELMSAALIFCIICLQVAVTLVDRVPLVLNKSCINVLFH